MVPEQEEAVGRWQSPSIWRWPKFRFGDCDVVIEPDRSLWRTPTPSVYLCRPSLVEPLLLFICATGLMGKCFQRLISRAAVIGNDVYSPVLQLLVMPYYPSVYLCRPSLVEPLLLFICATGLMGKCFQRLFSRSAVIGNDVYSPVLQLLVMPLLSVCVLVSTVLG